MEDDAEAAAQRGGDESGPRRRADEREFREFELDGARGRALPDHYVELVVLHRGVEHFLYLRLEPVNLVDEEDFPLLKIRQDGREVAAALDCGGAHTLQGRVHLRRDDLRERRLAEARRAEEEHVVERLAPRLGRAQEDFEVRRYLRLPDVLFERARAQTGFDELVFRGRRARNLARHLDRIFY